MWSLAICGIQICNACCVVLMVIEINIDYSGKTKRHMSATHLVKNQTEHLEIFTQKYNFDNFQIQCQFFLKRFTSSRITWM